MKSSFITGILCMAIGALCLAPSAFTEEPVKVLFLTKSAGFEHSVVHREKGELGHAEKILLDLAKDNNLFVVVSKDAGMINEKQLAVFDVVVFYTTGDLTQPSKDNGTPMSAQGVTALVNWVKNGGGFVGSHTASDTFHENLDYRKLSGGVFKTHGQQETATMKVVKHPITAHLGDTFTTPDEYYMFKDTTNTFQPLLILQTKEMKQEMYNSVEPYPITWIEELGEGRIFNCALGHREDVWTNPDFQKLLINGIKWAAKQL
ncbi:MAG: ThuA domain-containing protein [Candidatus Omnitrophica bacterium]|nr:ThuA domain-containing protein [Candidatus Omnitrophota bacterium]